MESTPFLFLENSSLLFVLGLHLLVIALDLVCVHLIDSKLDEFELPLLGVPGHLDLLLLPLQLGLVLIRDHLLVLLDLALSLLIQLVLLRRVLLVQLLLEVTHLLLVFRLQLFLVQLEFMLDVKRRGLLSHFSPHLLQFSLVFGLFISLCLLNVLLKLILESLAVLLKLLVHLFLE